LQHQLLTGWCM